MLGTGVLTRDLVALGERLVTALESIAEDLRAVREHLDERVTD